MADDPISAQTVRDVVEAQSVMHESVQAVYVAENAKLRAAAVDLQNRVLQLHRALTDARACMEWCVSLGADEQTAKSLRRGIAVIDAALAGKQRP